jgi:hypothetical protein
MLEKNLTYLVDTEDDSLLVSGQRDDGQGGGEGGSKICADVWSEFLLVAKYLYSTNPEAEIADVFEWLRRHDLGGEEISESLLKRVTREVITECGPFE